MLSSIIVLAVYVSFIIDLVIWSIPSEVSIISSKRSGGIISFKNRFNQLLILLFKILFYLYPLFLAIKSLYLDLYLWPNSLQLVLGLGICFTGRAISLLGTYSLYKRHNSSVVTDSIYGYSRNPITVGLHLTIFGLLIVCNHMYLWIAFIGYLVSFHHKIILEEKHLISKYGKQYSEYMLKTPRYIWK